jgi:hypothetical protein
MLVHMFPNNYVQQYSTLHYQNTYQNVIKVVHIFAIVKDSNYMNKILDLNTFPIINDSNFIQIHDQNIRGSYISN